MNMHTCHKTLAFLKHVLLAVFYMASIAAIPAERAHAADGTWNPTGFVSGGNATGLWSTPTNWTGGIVANGAGFQANFSTLNIGSDSTVSLDSSRTIGRLIFGDATTASNNWFLDNSGNAANILTLDNTGGTGAPKITVNNQTTTISAILAGINGVTLTGGTGATWHYRGQIHIPALRRSTARLKRIPSNSQC
jgi:hypothetical protein